MRKLNLMLKTLALLSMGSVGTENARQDGAKPAPRKILMVVTNADQLGATHKTGLWLEEFALPYIDFLAAGYEVTVASPCGGNSPIDPQSLSDVPDAWKQARLALATTRKLSQVAYQQYDAIVLPGGHGPLVDLANDELLADMLCYFDAHDRIIAAVCHGPAGLVKATKTDGTPLVAGKKMTGFTDEAESLTGLDALVPFALETELRSLGAKFESTSPWGVYVVVDGNLITGQNPQSSAAFAKAILETLDKRQ